MQILDSRWRQLEQLRLREQLEHQRLGDQLEQQRRRDQIEHERRREGREHQRERERLLRERDQQLLSRHGVGAAAPGLAPILRPPAAPAAPQRPTDGQRREAMRERLGARKQIDER